MFACLDRDTCHCKRPVNHGGYIIWSSLFTVFAFLGSGVTVAAGRGGGGVGGVGGFYVIRILARKLRVLFSQEGRSLTASVTRYVRTSLRAMSVITCLIAINHFTTTVAS